MIFTLGLAYEPYPLIAEHYIASLLAVYERNDDIFVSILLVSLAM